MGGSKIYDLWFRRYMRKANYIPSNLFE